MRKECRDEDLHGRCDWMTIEEVFNLQPGAGGIICWIYIGLFGMNKACLRWSCRSQSSCLTLKGPFTAEPYLPYVTVLSVPTLPFKINGRLPWTVLSIFSDLPFAAIRCWPRCLNEKRGARFRPFLLKYIMTKIRALLTPVLPCTTRSRYYFFVIFDVYTT